MSDAPLDEPGRKGRANRKGRSGEESARRYLSDSGWNLIGSNFRTRRGEIDIIATKADLIAFFEVKNWDYCPIEDLERAIDARKRGRIVETSKIFLDRHRQYKGAHVRYDVLFISDDGASIRHFESAFTE
jgi:putative endonuclease